LPVGISGLPTEQRGKQRKLHGVAAQTPLWTLGSMVMQTSNTRD